MELRIIQNLELSIENIHIMYQDDITNSNHSFSFGITINYISLHVLYNNSLSLFDIYLIRQQHLIGETTILEENMQLIHKVKEKSIR